MAAMTTPETLLQRLRKGRRFLLTSHSSPDGDAIGSELALARVLRSLGKSAWIWNRDAVPPLYRHLPGAERIHVGEQAPNGFPDDFDAVVVLECPDLGRTGFAADALAGLPLLNIDHHLGNQLYGQVNWVDSAAPAVGEMVHRLAVDLKTTIDADTATLLLLTVASDTGGFRFSNANVVAFEAAAALVRLGASPERVSLWLYESQPLPAVRLLGEMLGTLGIHAGGRVATVELTLEMFARAGAEPGDSEGLIDHARSIAGVEAAALFKELSDGRQKVSLRSRGPVDVERIARAHQGGGHRNAAGCVLSGPAGEARQTIVEALSRAVEGVHA